MECGEGRKGRNRKEANNGLLSLSRETRLISGTLVCAISPEWLANGDFGASHRAESGSSVPWDLQGLAVLFWSLGSHRKLYSAHCTSPLLRCCLLNVTPRHSQCTPGDCPPPKEAVNGIPPTLDGNMHQTLVGLGV
jgi:hypothetical protein